MLTTLHLSDWLDWADRTALPDSAGVYVIAKGDRTNVIYIGRTWGIDGVFNRIKTFNRSANSGNKGHAGGVTFHKTFGPDVSDFLVSCHTPVTINPDPNILRPYIEYAERRLIWEHVEKFGQLPVCNSE